MWTLIVDNYVSNEPETTILLKKYNSFLIQADKNTAADYMEKRFNVNINSNINSIVEEIEDIENLLSKIHERVRDIGNTVIVEKDEVKRILHKE